MSITLKDGAMVLLAVGGVFALASTAEIGLSGLALGTGMSIVSGILAANGNSPKTPNHSPIEEKTKLRRRNDSG